MKVLRQALLLCIFAATGVMTSAQAADAPKAVAKKEAAKDIVLRGDAKCTTCHDEADAPELLRIGKTKHGTRADGRTPSCTDCHGESEKHVGYKGSDKPPKPDRSFGKNSQTSAEDRSGTCLTCHQSGNRIAWQASTHAARDVTCSNCHTVHGGKDKVRDTAAQTETCFTCHKEQRAQMSRPSHHPVPEGKMSCSSCHNVHGDNPKQMVRASVNETCYSCHMEKRGPFLHNHQPVSEDCTICHQPHGTTAANLLKARAPFLCQECHSHSSHPSQAAGIPTGRATGTSVLGTVARGCSNCHTNIHGSNSTQNSATAERFRR